MTQEDKQLLLKDLCARLPHRVIVHICSRGKNAVRDVILSEDNITNAFEVPEGWWKEIKPYLRPMSSMTKEERHELEEIIGNDIEISDDFINIIDSSRKRFSFLELQAIFDWLNKKMFDYMDLIPKGLALEAPKDMYK